MKVYYLVNMNTGEALYANSNPYMTTLAVNHFTGSNCLEDLAVTPGDSNYIPAEEFINTYPI